MTAEVQALAAGGEIPNRGIIQWFSRSLLADARKEQCRTFCVRIQGRVDDHAVARF